MPTSPCHVSRGFCRLLQNLESPRSKSCLLRLGHMGLRVENVRRSEEVVGTDAQVPVDAQNASTGTWKLQKNFLSTNNAPHLFEKDSNQSEENSSVNLV